MSLKTIITSFILLIFSIAGNTQSASELLKSLDDLMAKADDKKASVQIITTNKSGKQKIKEAEMYEKGREKKLYRYTKPESQAGIATLSLSGGIMWMYMPAFGRATKISMLSKSQAITGTDFAYEDMNYVPYSTMYIPVIENDQNPDYYILSLTPKSNESDYESILLYLNKQHRYPIKMEYFNKKKELFKEATYKYVQKNGYWYAEEVVMKNLKKEHSTKIILSDIKFNQGLQDSIFTVEYLKQFSTENSD